MSYSNYNLSQRINNLQQQINSGGGGSQTLGDVMTLGNTASTDLNMNSNSITNLNSITSDTSLTGQITFTQPPHSVTPILGDDLTTKGYVDSLVGQYSGGYNLYLNYSDTVDATYKKLSSTVSNASQQTIITTTAVGTFLLQSFITNAINITEIPSGLWSLYLYGAVSAIGGILTYSYIVKLKSGVTITTIGTSGNSQDVNATPTGDPDVYHLNVTIPTAITCLITDQIIIEIYYTKTGASVSLYTYFESNYYSFVQTTLNAGTTLLSSNNNWTAENVFNGNIRLNSTLKDTSGSVGTLGQYLSSTGSGTSWISQSSGSTYIAYTASTTLPTITNPTLLVVVSGITVGIVITIPTGYSLGQKIQIKNNASNSISIATVDTVFTYASIALKNLLTLDSGDVANFYYTGFSWIQYSPSNVFNKLYGNNGCLAGQTNYVSINTSALPQTVSTVINTDMFVFLVGSTALKVLSIPVVTNVGQRMTIKNTASVDVSLAFPSSNVMVFDSLTVVSAVILKSKGTISLYWGGAFWIQTVPSNAMPELTTSGNISSTAGSISASTTVSSGSTITAATGITSTTGDIVASSGSISASSALSAPSVNGLATTANLGICSTQSTGVLNLGIGPRTKTNGTAEGNINIGTGNNTITSGTTAPTINIGNNPALTNLTEISIGATNTKTTINGPLTLTGAITANGGNLNVSAGSISAGTTITAATGITSTSGNITATAGNILGQILRNNGNTGSISSTGLINASSLTSPSLTTATATTLLLGTTTATALTIGSASIITTINGTLTTGVGIISGNSAYDSTSATSFTISNAINKDYYLLVLLASGTSIITMPTLKANQIVHIRVYNGAGTAITVRVPAGGSFYPNGMSTSFATQWTAFPSGTTQNFYCTGSDWVGF